MEIPKWAFKAESSAKADGSIHLVFALRPLGRAWLFVNALLDLILTSKITIVVEVKGKRPRITHAGEVVEPQLDHLLDECEMLEFARRVPTIQIPRLVSILNDRDLFAHERRDDRRKA